MKEGFTFNNALERLIKVGRRGLADLEGSSGLGWSRRLGAGEKAAVLRLAREAANMRPFEPVEPVNRSSRDSRHSELLLLVVGLNMNFNNL